MLRNEVTMIGPPQDHAFNKSLRAHIQGHKLNMYDSLAYIRGVVALQELWSTRCEVVKSVLHNVFCFPSGRVLADQSL
jgi:hypothetical protein